MGHDPTHRRAQRRSKRSKGLRVRVVSSTAPARKSKAAIRKNWPGRTTPKGAFGHLKNRMAMSTDTYLNLFGGTTGFALESLYEQAFLMEIFDDIDLFFKTTGPKKHPNFPGDEKFKPLLKFNSIGSINTKSPDTLMNRFKFFTDARDVELLNSLTPAEYVALVPKIKLYYMEMLDQYGERKDIREKEIVFPSHTDQNVVLVPAAVTDYSLKSFTYRLLADNPAVAKKVDAEVKIVFKDLSSFMNIHPNGFSFVDLLSYKALQGERFLKQTKDSRKRTDEKRRQKAHDDAVEAWRTGGSKGPKPTKRDPPTKKGKFKPTRKEKKQALHSMGLWSLKAEIGWSLSGDFLGTVKNQRMKRLNNMQTTLSLAFYKHEMEFKESGALELTLKYVGSIETVFRLPEANVFAEITANEREDAESGKGTIAGVRGIKYAYFIRSLLMCKRNRNDEASIYWIDVPEDAWKAFIKYINTKLNGSSAFGSDVSTGELTEKSKDFKKKKKSKKIKPKSGDKGTADDFGDWIVNDIKAADANFETLMGYWGKDPNNLVKSVTQLGTDDYKGGQKTPKRGKSNSYPDRKWKEEGVKRIYFLAMGDILDNALEAFKHRHVPHHRNSGNGCLELTPVTKKTKVPPTWVNKPGDPRDLWSRYRVLVGPMVLAYPNFQEYGTNVPFQIKQYPIAHMPVALNQFLHFFLWEIIKSEREVIPFDTFTREILRYMFDGGSFIEKTAALQKVDLYNTVGVKPTRKLISLRHDYVDFENVEHLLFQPNRYEGYTLRSKRLCEYTIIHGTSNLYNKHKKHNYKWDMSLGIPHFYWGADRGILKRLKFKRVSDKHLETVQFKKGGVVGALYEINMDLVGTPAMGVGELIYVDAARHKFGKRVGDKSAIAQLGLAGYYRTLEIEHTIEPGVYETNMRCLMEGTALIHITKKKKPVTSVGKP